ncbi:MAG TPA: L,D-transpeptidase [Rhizomicrobium sp.]|jgi:lipoprotein-anchoring transpeptidase ErfK/SrfK|nr:L,D-transpeptidase [Rhizomicrobium sp.]
MDPMRCGKSFIICVASLFLGLAGAFAIAEQSPGTTASPPHASASSPPVASKQPEGRAIEAVKFADALPPDAQRRLLIKVEVLLDRAHFSPGVIDGTPGENLHNALAAYAAAHGLATEGTLTAQIFNALAGADKTPMTQDYTITADDEKGPFIGSVPEDFVKLARLKYCGYRSPEQELAEKFHMSEALLRALNRDADFHRAGTSILVLRPGNGNLPTDIARLEVDKSANQLRVYDNAGTLVAVFPATVGSAERPAPSGRWAVKDVTFNPSYIYNPKELTFGPKHKGLLKIAPGPNNPTGLVWIELTKPTYGIHGAPDPELIGKTASHGCVRLTNWDAVVLGRAVKPGTPVIFVGQTTKA